MRRRSESNATRTLVGCFLGLAATAAGSVALAAQPFSGPAGDWRNIQHGAVIPDEGYCDQPYVVVTRDGNWLCTLTTGKGVEGEGGQHVVAAISADHGQTWSRLIDIEPASGPDASWAMPLVTPSGRVYVFYDYNGDNVHRLGDAEGIRADMLGWYVYKYSDDNGRTWSAERYRLPIRQTTVDDANNYEGKVQLLWGIGKPIVADGKVILGFSKIGDYLIDLSEGWFMVSGNILTEPDPARIEWVMRPEGQIGLQPVRGPIGEEQNLVPLSGGRLYTMYRTTEGHPCNAYSDDCARSWTLPAYAEYATGQPIKHPRACPRIWKTKNGRYLFWYHNNGGRSYEGRNPAWISGGVEKNGRILWSHPEILLYDPVREARISYPDLVEQDGRYWVTETQKSVARVHEVDPALIEGLFTQGTLRQVARDELALDATAEQIASGGITVPAWPRLCEGRGFTIEMWIGLEDSAAGHVLLDTRNAAGKGIVLETAGDGAVRIEMNDGGTGVFWDSDRGVLRPGRWHHLACVVDGGPRVISYVVDGVLCDGGTQRPYGWGVFSSDLEDVNGERTMRIGKDFNGRMRELRVYHRALRTSEVIANYHAGR